MSFFRTFRTFASASFVVALVGGAAAIGCADANFNIATEGDPSNDALGTGDAGDAGDAARSEVADGGSSDAAEAGDTGSGTVDTGVVAVDGGPSCLPVGTKVESCSASLQPAGMGVVIDGSLATYVASGSMPALTCTLIFPDGTKFDRMRVAGSSLAATVNVEITEDGYVSEGTLPGASTSAAWGAPITVHDGVHTRMTVKVMGDGSASVSLAEVEAFSSSLATGCGK